MYLITFAYVKNYERLLVSRPIINVWRKTSSIFKAILLKASFIFIIFLDDFLHNWEYLITHIFSLEVISRYFSELPVTCVTSDSICYISVFNFEYVQFLAFVFKH